MMMMMMIEIPKLTPEAGVVQYPYHSTGNAAFSQFCTSRHRHAYRLHVSIIDADSIV